LTWNWLRARSIWARRPSSRGRWLPRPGRGAARAPRPPGHRGRHPAQGPLCRQLPGSLRPLRRAGRDSAGSRFRPDLPPRGGRCRGHRTLHYCAGDGNRLLSKETVLRLKMCCASRCFCPCRSGRCASLTARDFARAAAKTATASPAPAMRVRATPAGRRWPASAAGSSPKKPAPREIEGIEGAEARAARQP
jgi:hypothetical protein